MQNNNYITVKEVSSYLNIPLRTVYDLIKKGKIRSIRIGGRIRCSMSECDEYSRYGTDNIPAYSQKPPCENEKREAPRINTYLDCRYLISLGKIKNIIGEGFVRNISKGGMLIDDAGYGASAVAIDDPIDLKFILPINGGGKNKTRDVSVKGRVIRKVNNRIAVKFRSVDQGLKKDIAGFVG